MPFTPVESAILNAIQSFPTLYDKSSAGYYIKSVRENAWKEVARTADVASTTTSTELCSKWRNIRAKILRYLKMKENPPRGKPGGKWQVPEMERHRWLFEYVEYRKTISNINVVPEAFHGQLMSEAAAVNERCQKDERTAKRRIKITNKKKKKRVMCSPVPPDDELLGRAAAAAKLVAEKNERGCDSGDGCRGTVVPSSPETHFFDDSETKATAEELGTATMPVENNNARCDSGVRNVFSHSAEITDDDGGREIAALAAIVNSVDNYDVNMRFGENGIGSRTTVTPITAPLRCTPKPHATKATKKNLASPGKSIGQRTNSRAGSGSDPQHWQSMRTLATHLQRKKAKQTGKKTRKMKTVESEMDKIIKRTLMMFFKPIAADRKLEALLGVQQYLMSNFLNIQPIQQQHQQQQQQPCSSSGLEVDCLRRSDS